MTGQVLSSGDLPFFVTFFVSQTRLLCFYDTDALVAVRGKCPPFGGASIIARKEWTVGSSLSPIDT